MTTPLTEENKCLSKLEEYIMKYYPSVKGSHFTTMVDIIYMAAVRGNLGISKLLEDMYNGILEIEKFNGANNGNIYEFIKPKYKLFAERIKDINIGSNGGMANIGKGEWLISLLAGINPQTDKPYVDIIKTGEGDIKYSDGKNEEIKWNGGKVSVEKAGYMIQDKFNKLVPDHPDKLWLPLRSVANKKYSKDKILNWTGKYWQAISGEECNSMTDDEYKKNIINMSFAKVFEKSDSFIMFNDDGKFQRFYNLEDANSYYIDKLHLLKSSRGFEHRAKQANPPALYCYVF